MGTKAKIHEIKETRRHHQKDIKLKLPGLSLLVQTLTAAVLRQAASYKMQGSTLSVQQAGLAPDEDEALAGIG